MPENFDKVTNLLRKSYFWDIDISRVTRVPKRLIVERIFSFGTLDEVALVIRLYGKKDVEKILINLNYLDRKTLNFVSRLFNRPRKDFRCYTRKQLTVQHCEF